MPGGTNEIVCSTKKRVLPGVRAAPPHWVGKLRRVFVQALELLVVPAKEVSNG